MVYDLIIVGSSAAGVSAGIYAARRGLNVKVITVDTGGEVALSGIIENYPGFAKTDGVELSDKFRDHLIAAGVTPETGIWVEKVEKKGDIFTVSAKRGDEAIEYRAKTVLVATGVHPKKLKIPGEEEFRGKGVTYCTVCDGPLFRGKTTVTIGSGNSALESALMMATLATKVYVISKYPQMKGEEVLIANLAKQKNVEMIYAADTLTILGDQFVQAVEYRLKSGGPVQRLDVAGVMVHIGMVPNSTIVGAEVQKTPRGEIQVNQRCETSVPGLFAAGDVTDIPYKQITISTGQGAVAALAVVDYLNRLKS